MAMKRAVAWPRDGWRMDAVAVAVASRSLFRSSGCGHSTSRTQRQWFSLQFNEATLRRGKEESMQ